MGQDNIPEVSAALKPFADAWDEYVRDGGPDGKASAEILFRPDSEFIAASEAMKPNKPGLIPECSACGKSRLELSERVAALEAELATQAHNAMRAQERAETAEARARKAEDDLLRYKAGNYDPAESIRLTSQNIRAEKRAQDAEAQACRMREALLEMKRMFFAQYPMPIRTEGQALFELVECALAPTGPCQHEAELAEARKLCGVEAGRIDGNATLLYLYNGNILGLWGCHECRALEENRGLRDINHSPSCRLGIAARLRAAEKGGK
jgi:hypothetical protein